MEGVRRLVWLSGAAAAVLGVLQPIAAPAGEGEPLAGTRSQLGFAPTAAQPGAGGEWKVEVHPSPVISDEFRATIGDRVFFAPGSNDLSARARTVLNAQAAWLRRNPSVVVTVEGHADDPGTALQNRALAERRAEIVRRRLLEEGVAPERIMTVSLGNDRPVALCREAVCSAQNRRAVSHLNVTGPAPHAASGRAMRGDERARSSLPR